jgi:hypothetical protein
MQELGIHNTKIKHSLQSLTITFPLLLLDLWPRLIPKCFLEPSTIPCASTKSSTRFQSPTRILTDSFEQHLSQHFNPNWSQHLGFFLENFQSLIIPKSNLNWIPCMFFPKLESPTHIASIVTIDNGEMWWRIEKDEWLRLVVFLSKNTQWHTQRFSSE